MPYRTVSVLSCWFSMICLMFGGAIAFATPKPAISPDAHLQIDATPQALSQTTGRLHTWEMPAVDVVANSIGGLHEEQRIGSYGQPRWTAHRRFPTTRVYVRPAGEIEAEQWMVSKSRHGKRTEFDTETELEIGLPHRFQVDLYFTTLNNVPGESEVVFEPSIEMRYAFADWDKLPGNPTYYLEYIHGHEEAPDRIEQKMLLGGEIAPRWHWGANFFWEHEMGGAQTDEIGVSGGLSYTVIDEKLSVGIETKDDMANDKTNRSTWDQDLRVGPSLQYRITNAMHIDVTPLFGINHKSKTAEVYVVLGYEF